jgi:DNA-binding Lrp family transcriptional regulator
MKIALSEKEGRILVASQLRANASITELQEELGIPDYAIRRTIRRLIDQGVIAPRTLINVHPLGFDKAGVFFSLATGDPLKRQAGIDYIGSLESVVSLYELSGEHEYFAVLATRGAMALADALSDIAENVESFEQSAISTRISLSLYQRTYLSDPQQERGFVRYHMTGEGVRILPDDVAIIEALDAHGVLSPAGVARLVSQPVSSVAYRVARLERHKVICGYLYHVRPGALGLSSHHILIACRNYGRKMHDKLHEFCMREPNVAVLAKCLGSWQFEMRVETGDATELTALCSRIKRELGADLIELKSHSIVREMRYMRSSFIRQAVGATAEDGAALKVAL